MENHYFKMRVAVRRLASATISALAESLMSDP